MFVNIRVYRTIDSQLDIVKAIIPFLDTSGTPIYKNYYRNNSNEPIPVSGCTSLSDLSSKLIFSFDITNLLQIYTPSTPETSEMGIGKVPKYVRDSLSKFVNIYTGGSTWMAFYRYSDITTCNKQLLRIEDNDNPQTNVKFMYIVYPYPTKDDSNPDSYDLIEKHSIQTIPFRVYIEDENLTKYLQLFKTNGYPLLPLYKAHHIIESYTSGRLPIK